MLEQLFGSRLRARVIGWLFSHPDERFYVRELMGLLGEDATNLGRELGKLESLGIVTSQREGQQKYYRPNPQCPVFDELVGLAVKTAGIADVLRAALLAHVERIHTALIYGSVARRDHTAESDIDLLLIGSASTQELLPALGELETKLAREINVLTLSESEFAQRLADSEPFITSILNAPMIFLIGDREQLEAMRK
jgi:predicted nucleotidyltransferase